MPNPYAPRGPVKVATESVSELDAFLDRLRRLGADDEAIDEVREHWDDFDESWTPETRRELARKNDSELRRAILAIDEEYDASTLTEEEVEQTAEDRARDAARAEAPGHMGDTIPNILDWVDYDPIRAEVVLALESSPEGAGRKTLIEQLESQLGRLNAEEPDAAE